MLHVHRAEGGGYKVDKGGKNGTPEGSTWRKNEAVGADGERGRVLLEEYSERVEE